MTYNALIQYLTTLTYPKDYDESQRTTLRKTSIQYLVKNNLLYRRTKEGERRVILHEQMEIIPFNIHKDLTGVHLRMNATFEKVKE